MRDTLSEPPSFPSDSPLTGYWTGGKGRFLIDGFPRKMDQAVKFDNSVSIILIAMAVQRQEPQLMSHTGLQVVIRPFLHDY